MSIEDQGQTARVSFGYSIKVPGGAPYSSEDAHASFSVEFDLAGATFEETFAQLEEIESKMASVAKGNVYTQLGMQFTEAAGVMSPVWPAGAPQASSGGGGGGGGGGQQFSKPLVAKSEKPIVVINGVQHYDNRPFKVSGQYKPGAADFASVQGNDPLWLRDQQGNLNAETTAALDASGIAWE